MDNFENKNREVEGVAGSFLDGVNKSKRLKTPGSDLPDFFPPGQAPIDKEYEKLMEEVYPAKKAPNVQEYKESANSSKISYNFDVKLFRMDNPNQVDQYKSLMNRIYNSTETFIDLKIMKNWDKAGYLSIVVEFVEKIETKDEPVKDAKDPKKSEPPKPGAHVVVQKAVDIFVDHTGTHNLEE